MRTPNPIDNFIISKNNIPDVDVYITALGYESRSTEIANFFLNLNIKKVAYGFKTNQVLSYENNKAWFKENKFDCLELSDEEFEKIIPKKIFELVTEGCTKFCIDISCFNRSRLAALIHGLSYDFRVDIDTIFTYTIASFDKPSNESNIPNTIVSPIHPSFSGLTFNMEFPTVAVVGLGYEQDRAIGAIEYVQASKVKLFKPISPIIEYEQEVDIANNLLYEYLSNKDSVLEYMVQNPLHTYVILENYINRISFENSVIIFPFGPKVFTLISLLIALIHRTTSIWRVSKGKFQTPVDRKASKYFTGIQVRFSKQKGNQIDYKKLIDRGYFENTV